ncbi:MAG: hypothetical protein P9M15_03485 [Candidatus Electryoneaceae bacterium]|nr:hypothetical protein [Candidatus Electryoneaceae bacterium]
MRTKLGQTLLKMGFVTQEQLDEALTMQKQGHVEMGQVLKYLGLLNSEQIEQILEFQKTDPSDDKTFGVCAVRLGLITDKHRAIAKIFQFTSRRILGDILIQLGYLTEEQREEALKRQFVV